MFGAKQSHSAPVSRTQIHNWASGFLGVSPGRRSSLLLAALIWQIGSPNSVMAQEAKAEANPPEAESRGPKGIAGPDQVDQQLERDETLVPHWELSFLNSYHGFKNQLKEDSGLSYGVDYSAVGFGTSASVGENWSAGGMVRLYGAWDLVDRGGPHQGGVVFKVEHRHAYTEGAPSGFGFNMGYVGLQEPPFSDQGARLTNLYWRQTFADNRVVILAGFVDATDYVDVYALASPWTHFMNFAFSTGGGSLSVPNEGLGFAAGAWATDNIYAVLSLNDQNSDPARPWETFGRFFSEHQYFKSIELGWTTGRDRAYFDNVHVTAWHADAKQSNGDPSGWGVNASASWLFAGSFMPFLRGGYAKDAGSLYEGTASVGAAYQSVPGQDVLALGFNWSKPNRGSFGPGLRNQWTAELFYRWQISKELALTPDAQLIVNPALATAIDPASDVAFVGGLRARLAL